MKRVVLLFLLLPLYSLACSCDPPPVALEFLKAKYVFWGTAIKKEYAKDSLNYTVTFKIEKNFKKHQENSPMLKVTLPAEGEITGTFTSCDFRVNKGESWLVYAYYYQDKLTLSDFCSNSNRYNNLDEVGKQELEILAAGDEIDLNKIVFETTGNSGLLLLKEFQKPNPMIPLDRVFTQVKPATYENLDISHFENFVLRIDSKGNITQIVVPRLRPGSSSNVKVKKVYDFMYSEYTANDSLNSELQNELMAALKKGGKWVPAKFMGRNVHSQVLLQVYFKNKIPEASSIN